MVPQVSLVARVVSLDSQVVSQVAQVVAPVSLVVSLDTLVVSQVSQVYRRLQACLYKLNKNKLRIQHWESKTFFVE